MVPWGTSPINEKMILYMIECSYEYYIIINMRDVLRFFKSLSDPTRLRILHLLMHNDLCVCELTSILKMEQSRISHQLRILRNAELIEDRREGKWIIYRIPNDSKKSLRLIFNLLTGDLARSELIKKDKKNLEFLDKSLRKPLVEIERV